MENVTLKSCLFGATNIVKNSDKAKWVFSGYGIAFDGAGLLKFCNGFGRNVVIFGVNNSSLSHSDNCSNNFLILGEGPTSDISSSFCSPEKSLVLILLTQIQNFA